MRVESAASGITTKTVIIPLATLSTLNYQLQYVALSGRIHRQFFDSKTNSWETVTITPEGKITGLTPGVKHYFRVYAINNSGESTKPSSVASVTLPPTAPEEPKNLAITNITDKTATLTWDTVA
ncbi:MAG: fibronectin type III domain-containing protein, partial [Planctomycetaceae bacterium]|nr:fibronectin type III domain-containing protein [Planctomycetaceae bacterium]